MSRPSKHEKTRRYFDYHDAQAGDPEGARRVVQYVTESGGVMQDAFEPTRVCTRREHELLQSRISNQRRELRYLNRAYRRREDENLRKLTQLREQLAIAKRVNRNLHDQIKELQIEARRF